MMKHLGLLAALILTGCSPRLLDVIRPAQSQPVSGKPAIIFVHGFYGSALRERSGGRRIFYTGREILFGKSALSLFQRELDTPPGPELEVEGLLGTVPVIPSLYEVDVYADIIRRLENEYPGHQVLPLVYDWRDDLSKPVAELASLVKKLRAQKSPTITLMAHSMGGRVAAYYLAYGDQTPEQASLNWAGAREIPKAVFFGTPFRGSMISLRCFEKGSGLPGWSHLLPAETMGSFPALYELMPPGNSRVLSFQGKPEQVDILDPALWKESRFGLLRRQDLNDALRKARETFISTQLRKARLWNERLDLAANQPPPTGFRVLNVIGTSQETLEGAYFDRPSGKLLFDPSDLDAAGLARAPIFSAGDETVTVASATVPAAFAPHTKVVHSSASHTKLFLDANVEKEYKFFLAN